MSEMQTKEELETGFKAVKYLLTSSMRTKLLIAVYKNPKNLDDLRNELEKPSATILHGLKELESSKLIRKSKKYYQLTSNGYLLTTNMIKLIENWYTINKNKLFWNNHNINDIPEELLKNLYQLKDAEYINSTTSDLSNAFNQYLKLISTSSELKIILPIYSENHFKHISKLLKNKKLKKVEILLSEEILKSINKNKFFRKKIIENKKVRVILIEKSLKLFLTYSEDFMALTLFFNDGHYDDSQILISKTNDSINWAEKLFKYYRR